MSISTRHHAWCHHSHMAGWCSSPIWSYPVSDLRDGDLHVVEVSVSASTGDDPAPLITLRANGNGDGFVEIEVEAALAIARQLLAACALVTGKSQPPWGA